MFSPACARLHRIKRKAVNPFMAYYNGVQSVTNATVTGTPGRRASQCNIEISYVNENGGTDNVILRVNDATQLRSPTAGALPAPASWPGSAWTLPSPPRAAIPPRRWRAPIPSPGRARAAGWAWISIWADDGIIKNSPGYISGESDYQKSLA